MPAIPALSPFQRALVPVLLALWASGGVSLFLLARAGQNLWWPLLALLAATLVIVLVLRHRHHPQGASANADRLESELAARNRELEHSHRHYRDLVENTNSIILRWDTRGIVTFINRYGLDFFGFDEDEILGRSVMETIVPRTETTGRDLLDMIEDITRNPQDYVHNENENIKKNGMRVWVAWNNKAVVDENGDTVEILSIGNDITERKLYEQQIHQLAHYDSLTGLPNRILFLHKLETALAEAERHGQTVTLFYLDLDRFKPINDSLGHHNGDLLLQQLAERLNGCIRRDETLARMGGDEFTVILEPEPDVERAEQAARHVAGHMLSVMSEPFELNGHRIHVSGSIGIVIHPRDGRDAHELLRNADTAMYQAKQSRNAFRFYETRMNASSLRRLKLEAELREAITADALDIHFQPTVHLASGRVASLEALIRWPHPRLGEMEPGDFVPAAEESELIINLGNWTLREVMQRGRQWQTGGSLPVILAVNLSMRQFEQTGLVERLRQLFEETGLPPDRLGIEITESTVMQDTHRALDTLHRLHDMGIWLYIDDFGTGYSSLARLRELPIHTVKIDQRFVADILEAPREARIIGAIIAMAHNLGIRVVAEGVEHPAQLEYLLARGCDGVQGNLLSAPVPPDQVPELLARDFHFG